MRIASFAVDGRETYGVVRDDGLVEASAGFRQRWPTVRDLLSSEGFRQALADDTASARGTAMADVRMLPPVVRPGKIICVGLNYRTHIQETGREPPAYPVLFTRYPESLVGHRESLLRPSVSEQLDFEGELAVVMGRTAYRVGAASAKHHVAGYSCLNDGSVRDFQRHTIQFTAGKNFLKSGAFGPYLVTADELPEPEKQILTTRLNGAVVQQAEVSDLVFGIGALIEYISAILPLEPGDVIATGTTGGVGAARTPPLWMKPGDRVEVEISGIGILENPVTQG